MNELIRLAIDARSNARAEHSGFSVGAAVETVHGRVFTGCNIESSSYGLTICAERVAVFKALSEGEREFRKICVASDTATLTPPCGACRQILWDFCGDILVVLANSRGKSQLVQMSELLPMPFDWKPPG